jgi:large subunit ribosomal protein L19
MSQALIRKVAAKQVKPMFTSVESGDRVRVYTTVKEGSKERTQYFEGLVIRRRGGIGPGATFTVRRISSGIGVERIFPLHSPKITKIQVQRAAKVRRAKLHYMRERAGKAARMKEVPVKQADREVMHPWVDVKVKPTADAAAKPAAQTSDKPAPAKAAKVEAKAETKKPDADDKPQADKK